MLFLHFLTIFFTDFPLIFRCHNQRMEKINWIPRLKTLWWISWEKNLLTKSNFIEVWLPDPDFLGVTISSHVIHSRLLLFSRHLWTTQENQNWFIRSRRINCNWGENFWLSQKERFLEPIERSPYIFNYLWPGDSNYVNSIMLVITKIYISSSLFQIKILTSTKNPDLWIRFAVYIWY